MRVEDFPGADRLGGFEDLDHRKRLVDALATSIEQQGYRETTVADIVRIARTSRRNFYQHFADRAACFLTLFDASNDAVMEQVAAAVEPDQPLNDQVDSALGAYLDTLAARPGLSQSFARELPGLGQEGAARQRAVIERFAALLVTLVESGRREHPEIGPLTLDMAIIIVGGLRELTVIAIEQGRDLREIRPDAASSVKAILSASVADRTTDSGPAADKGLWSVPPRPAPAGSG